LCIGRIILEAQARKVFSKIAQYGNARAGANQLIYKVL